MTRKSFAKLQRSRAAATKRNAAGGDAGIPILKFPSIASIIAADSSLPQLVSEVSDDVDSNDPQSGSKPATKKPSISARCAIVAAAFRDATNGTTRRQLKGKSPLALIVVVPGRVGSSRSGRSS